MRSLGRILREDLCAPNDIDVWIGLPEEEHHRCSVMFKPKAMADLGEMNPATKAAFMTKASAPGGRPISEWRQAEFAGMVLALRQSRISGPNLVLPFDIDFAAGVMRNTPNFFYGPNDETVGHSGWGGSCVFADPVTGLHGAYVMSRQENTLLGDMRPRRIIDALYDCL